jgi:urease accessory protein
VVGHHAVGSAGDHQDDLASLVRADLGVMERDSRRMRGDGPFLFTQVINGVGVREVADHVLGAWRAAT